MSKTVYTYITIHLDTGKIIEMDNVELPGTILEHLTILEEANTNNHALVFHKESGAMLSVKARNIQAIYFDPIERADND